ncbi:hypothetical protein [Armatimonas sp.]|uniref:hypothetical protein n=1 Tax=Armatimonas sp. TaxID=1872638 RepID=UPI003752EE4E
MNRLILRDAPLRTALELYFRTVGIKNYVIDNRVLGLVTATGSVTGDAFPTALFPGVAYKIENGVWVIQGAQPDERSRVLLQNKLACPTFFGEPRRVAGVALRSQGSPLAIVEHGSPPDSEIRVVARGDHFGEAQVSAITEQGLVLAERAQRLEIPLTGLVPRPDGSPLAIPGVERAVFSDAPLASVLELLLKAGGPRFQFEGTAEGYVSGETTHSVLPTIWASLPMALSYRKENDIWHVTKRGNAPPPAPRFVSQEDIQQGRAQLPVIFGAPRRVAAVLLGEKPLALLETGNPPQTKRQTVTEGDTYESFRVEKITREGIVFNDGTRRFLVPLTPLSPKP